MLRIHKKNGFATIVEVIVTAVIFIVATVGILSTITMLRPQSETSNTRFEAAYAGKQMLHDLHRNIINSQCGVNCCYALCRTSRIPIGSRPSPINGIAGVQSG